MADNMMRISGRGADGTAKAINTDNNGRLNVVNRYDNVPIAIPKSQLKYELKYFDSFPRPTSIGSDGAVYGMLGGAKTGTIFSTADAFATIVEGYSFAAETPPRGVVFVTKLGANYIVITISTTDQTASIWKSTSLISGFTRVVNMTGGCPTALSISWYHGDGRDDKVLLVGEYGHTGTQKNLHATFDGGTTWSIIKQTTVVNAAQNSHFHHAVYDPYRARVWSAQGDGDNARLSYSDDLGATWYDVPVAPNSFGITKHQPTLMVPTVDKVLMAPDTNNVVPCVLSIPIDRNFKSLNGETFGLEWEHTVWGGDYCFNQYGQPPYVCTDSEIYMLYPNVNNKKRHTIVASGDGGATWHNVLTMNFGAASGTQFSSGLIGPDTAGFIYSYYVGADGCPRVFKATKIQWQTK